MQLVNENGIEFYSIERLSDIQNQMLRLLSIIDDICEENKLKYFLDGGTAIGAYRHQGFIPWDDDLDICLPKPDYLKLIEILKRMDKSKFFLFDYNLDLHYASYFGEKVDFLCSFDGTKRHIYPIKIDIIPLNLIKNTEESINENRAYRELANFIFYGKCDDKYIDTVKHILENSFDGDTKKFMYFYNTKYGLNDNYSDSLFARPAMNFSTPRLYSYNELFPIKRIPFSGIESYLPNSDMCLKDIYGDYMNFPPLDVRKPEAARVFNARNSEVLYSYLINKSKKNLFQMFMFSIKSTFLCK